MKKILLAIALVSVATLGGYAWLRDEAPSAEVQSWLQQLGERPSQSAAYLYLNGLDAPLGQSPAELGAARLAAYRRWVAEHGDAAAYAPEEQPALELAERPPSCEAEQHDCLDRLLVDAPQPLSAEAREVQERYRQFLRLDDYATLTDPSLFEPSLPLRLLQDGNRLLALQAMQVARAGDGAAALELLEDDIARLRRQLPAADQLVLKIVLTNLLSHDLDRLARLYRRGLIPPPARQAPLTEQERSLHLPFLREFGAGAALFGGMSEQSLGELVGNDLLSPLAASLAYKPQMTINAALLPFRELSARSRLSPAEFRQALQSSGPPAEPPMRLRNYVGSVLLAIATPDFDRYVGRLHDLDAQLKLLGLLPTLPADTAPSDAQLAALPEAGNPYQPDQPPFWNARTGQLCYTGPLPEHKGSRCL
jgi:hypothetical protein